MSRKDEDIANLAVMLDNLAEAYYITIENIDPGEYEEFPDALWSIELEDKRSGDSGNRDYTGVWVGRTLSGCVGRAWAGEPEDLTG